MPAGDSLPDGSHAAGWDLCGVPSGADPAVADGGPAPLDRTLIGQDHFMSDAYYSRVGGALKFELKSRLGRLFRFFPSLAETKDYLNLGSGAAPHPAFTNIDFYALRTKVSLLLKGFSFVQHDLRFPLPFPDQAFFGVYSEHCVEHLYPLHAQKLFKEIFRVLKPGGVFRCIVPDIAKYIAFYNGQLAGPAFSHYANGCEAIWSATQNWGHVSVWDAEMLGLRLRQAGFANVELCEFRQGRLPALLIDLAMRRPLSLYMEACKD